MVFKGDDMTSDKIVNCLFEMFNKDFNRFMNHIEEFDSKVVPYFLKFTSLYKPERVNLYSTDDSIECSMDKNNYSDTLICRCWLTKHNRRHCWEIDTMYTWMPPYRESISNSGSGRWEPDETFKHFRENFC